MAADADRLRARFAPHFDAMTAEDRATVAAALEVVQVPVGTRLIAHGEVNDRLYLIVAGEVDVTLQCPTTVLKLGRRSAGSWIGELGLIDPGPASASVEVRAPLEAWVLTHDAWVRMRRERPRAAAALTDLVCRDVAQRLRRSDALAFRREGDRVVLALQAEGERAGLLGHLKHVLGLGESR